MFRILFICGFLIMSSAVNAESGSDKADKSKSDMTELTSIFIAVDSNLHIAAIVDKLNAKKKIVKTKYTQDEVTIVKRFCDSMTGGFTTDVIAINREMTVDELARCKLHGVTDIDKIDLGEEVVVFAMNKSAKTIPLTRKIIWQALAADAFRDENDASSVVIPNPNKTWSDIDKDLPDALIKFVAPKEGSVLNDGLKYVGLQPGCRTYEKIAVMKQHRHYRSWYRSYCYKTRDDGVFITSDKKHSNVADRIAASSDVMGVMYYADWLKVADRLQALPVNGVMPSQKTIADGSYYLTRPHVVYAKKARVSKVPNLKKMIDEMKSESAIGKNGYLTNMGLIQKSK